MIGPMRGGRCNRKEGLPLKAKGSIGKKNNFLEIEISSDGIFNASTALVTYSIHG